MAGKELNLRKEGGIKKIRRNPIENMGEKRRIGGPGRPKGSVSGRKLALGALDDVVGKTKNLKKMKKAFQDYLEVNPLECFQKFVIPLLPKESVLEMKGELKQIFSADETIRKILESVKK